VQLFHYKRGALSELHDAICAASDHSFVEGGMACRADHNQVHLEISCELDNVPYRVPGDVVFKFQVMFFDHCARALKDAVEATGRHARRLTNFLDKRKPCGVQIGSV
jgi:hypothetical protein